MIVHSRNGGTLLVVAGFALWVIALCLFHEYKTWGIAGAHMIGASAFFAVACFLPDLQKTTFYSRKSAIGAVGFFAWLSILRLPSFREWVVSGQENPGGVNLVL